MRASSMSEESKRRLAAQKRERKAAAKQAYMTACRLEFNRCTDSLLGADTIETAAITDNYALKRITVLLRRKLVTRHTHPHAVWMLTQVVQSRPFIFADQPEIIGWLRENM